MALGACRSNVNFIAEGNTIMLHWFGAAIKYRC